MYFQASVCLLPVRETEEERARSSKAAEAMTVNKPSYCNHVSSVDGQRDTNQQWTDRT